MPSQLVLAPRLERRHDHDAPGPVAPIAKVFEGLILGIGIELCQACLCHAENAGGGKPESGRDCIVSVICGHVALPARISPARVFFMKSRRLVKNDVLGRRPSPGARARTDEQKKEVRDDLIAVGRHLFAVEDPSNVSLRRIAAKTGYSPGTVYKYFRDQHDLFIAIREQDMSRVVDNLEKIAQRIGEPQQRLRAVFLAAVRHWLKYPDQFRVLFAIHPEKAFKAGRPSFGKSAVVLRSYALYRQLVDSLFATYSSPPCSPRLATDAVIAATHGIIAFTMHTHSLEWSNQIRMAEEVLDALLFTWEKKDR